MPAISKGERTLVSTRIPNEHFKKLSAYVEAEGTTKSEFLADVLLAALEQVDLENLNAHQERLPLSA